MVGIVERRVPKCHDAIAHVFVDRAAVRHDDIAHRRQQAIDQLCQRRRVRLEPFRDRRKSAHVAEHDRHRPGFAAQPQALRMGRQHRHHLRCEVLAEGRANAAAIAIDNPIPEQQHRRAGGHQRGHRFDERQPQIVRKGQLRGAGPSSNGRYSGERRKARRQKFRHRPGQRRGQQDRRNNDDIPAFRRGTDEITTDDGIDDVGQALDPRHRRIVKGLSEAVAAADERGADQDDAAQEPVGRNPPSQQVGEGESRKRVTRSPVIDHHPHCPVGRHPQLADADAGTQRQRYLRPSDIEISRGCAYRQRWQEIGLERQGDVIIAWRAVAIVGDARVAEPAGGRGERLDRQDRRFGTQREKSRQRAPVKLRIGRLGKPRGLLARRFDERQAERQQNTAGGADGGGKAVVAVVVGEPLQGGTELVAATTA